MTVSHEFLPLEEALDLAVMTAKGTRDAAGDRPRRSSGVRPGCPVAENAHGGIVAVERRYDYDRLDPARELTRLV